MRKLKYIAALACAICLIGNLNPVRVQAETAGTEVNVDGESLYIRNSFEDDVIPEGFSKGTMQYNGSGISVLKSSDEQITLVYMTDEDGENGAFYQYHTDGENNTFSKYIQVSGNGKYLIVTEPSGVSVPDGYVETSLTINGQAVTAFQESGAEDGFYLVYGVNDEQSEGLYRYDSSDGTYVRYVESSTATATDEAEVDILRSRMEALQDEYEANQDMLFKIMCGLMALSGVLVLVIISLLFRNATLRKAGGGTRSDDVTGFSEAEPEESVIQPVKKEKKKRRRKEADPEDDYDDLGDLTAKLPDLDDVTGQEAPDLLNIKVDIDDVADQGAQRKSPEKKAIPEEIPDEEFLDEGFTGEIEPVSEELFSGSAEALRKGDTQDIMSGISEKIQQFDKKEAEIEDYDDFELEILDLDDE